MDHRIPFWTRIRNVVARIFGTHNASSEILGLQVATGTGGSDHAADPFVGVRVPKRRWPADRSAAIALQEPNESRLPAKSRVLRAMEARTADHVRSIEETVTRLK